MSAEDEKNFMTTAASDKLAVMRCLSCPGRGPRGAGPTASAASGSTCSLAGSGLRGEAAAPVGGDATFDLAKFAAGPCMTQFQCFANQDKSWTSRAATCYRCHSDLSH